jgi:hypothetical protein
LLVLSAGSSAQAPATTGSQVAPQQTPTGEVEFKSVLPLNQIAKGIEPQLRGGRVAHTPDWPASFYFVFTTAEGRDSSCTAALLGPQLLLTAAHCIPRSKTVGVALGERPAISAKCEQHPDFVDRSDVSADYALCKLDTPVEPFPGLRYERLDGSSIDDALGKTVILTGYGCISDIVAERERQDRLYRIGVNSISETSNSPSRKHGPEYYRGYQDNNIITVDDPRRDIANLCPGDSGGPAFVKTGSGVSQFTNRQIIGVNSRVFYRENTSKTKYGASLIASTGTGRFRRWAEAWAKENQVEGCGLRGELTNCRL